MLGWFPRSVHCPSDRVFIRKIYENTMFSIGVQLKQDRRAHLSQT